MAPEASLPHSQASATCPYPVPAQSRPHTHIPPPGDQNIQQHEAESLAGQQLTFTNLTIVEAWLVTLNFSSYKKATRLAFSTLRRFAL
jgi:hypothetical protein